MLLLLLCCAKFLLEDELQDAQQLRCQLPCESLGERFGAMDLNMNFRILNEELKNPRILKIAGFSLMFMHLLFVFDFSFYFSKKTW